MNKEQSVPNDHGENLCIKSLFNYKRFLILLRCIHGSPNSIYMPRANINANLSAIVKHTPMDELKKLIELFQEHLIDGAEIPKGKEYRTDAIAWLTKLYLVLEEIEDPKT